MNNHPRLEVMQIVVVIVQDASWKSKAMSSIIMSLVKRVAILPDGLESKNRIADLMTLCIIELCIFVVDASMIACISHDLANTKLMNPTIVAANHHIH